MAKTITLRLDDTTYQLFHDFAELDNRSISNMIETAAKRYLENSPLTSLKETEDIKTSKKLVNKLKRGSLAAKQRKGRFVD